MEDSSREEQRHGGKDVNREEENVNGGTPRGVVGAANMNEVDDDGAAPMGAVVSTATAEVAAHDADPSLPPLNTECHAAADAAARHWSEKESEPRASKEATTLTVALAAVAAATSAVVFHHDNGTHTNDCSSNDSTNDAAEAAALASAPKDGVEPIHFDTNETVTSRSNHPLDHHHNSNNSTSINSTSVNNNNKETEASAVGGGVDAAAATTATTVVGVDNDKRVVEEEKQKVEEKTKVIYLNEDKRSRRPCLQRHVYIHHRDDTINSTLDNPESSSSLSLSSRWYLDAVVPSTVPPAKKSTRTTADTDTNGSTTNPYQPHQTDTTATLTTRLLDSPTSEHQRQQRIYQRYSHEAKRIYLPRLLWYAILEECQVAWFSQKTSRQRQHAAAAPNSAAATGTTTTATTRLGNDANATSIVDLESIFCLPVSFTPASLANRVQQGCLWMARNGSGGSHKSNDTNEQQQQEDNAKDRTNKAPRGRPRRSEGAIKPRDSTIPSLPVLLDDATTTATPPTTNNVTTTNHNTSATIQTTTATTTKAAAVSSSVAVTGPSYLSAQLGGRVAMALMQPKEDWHSWNRSARRQSGHENTVLLDDADNEEEDNAMQDETTTFNKNDDGDDEYLVTHGDDEQQQGGGGETSDVVDETELILNNPYLQPSTAEIVAWMGHFGNKVFTTAAIQEAMVGQPGMVWPAESMQKTKKEKRIHASIGSTTGMPAREVLSETDTFVWSELLLLRSNSNAATSSLSAVAQRNGSGSENVMCDVIEDADGTLPTAAVANFVFGEAPTKHNDTVRLVLQVAGEGLTPTSTLEELMELETAAFGRIQFTVRIVNETAWDALYNDVTEQAASRLHTQKMQRAWEAYRSKGTQTGFCEWGRSSWFEAVGASSVMASVAVVASSVVVPAAVGELVTTSAGSNAITATSMDDSDLALAQSLADQTETADDSGARGTGRRRKTRRAGESAGVYYGNQSNLTQKQLMDAMLRFISLSSFSSHQKPFQPLAALLKSIPDDSTDPMRRIRTALGRLLYKRNQLTRINVQTEWSDLPIWKALQGTPLWTSPSTPDARPGERASGSTETALNEPEEMKRLVKYIQALHQTELHLRRMVMKRLSDIPIALIACAADDRAGSMDAMDDMYFEDAEKVEWQSTGHALLSRRIFRPSSRHETDATSACYWYQLTSFVSSVPSSSPEVAVNPLEKPNIGRAKEPTGVERRMRFLATPVDPNGTNQSPLILTEGQVKAGLKAAELNDSQTETSPLLNNPFASGELQDITLFPPSGSQVQPINGCVVGHDRYIAGASEVVHKILVLPNRDAPYEEAFWGTLNFSSVSGAIECSVDEHGDLYNIQQFDYHPSSQAFQECLDIVKYLQRHPKGTVFQEPVDPIVLGIPDYPLIVKNPMDVSTLLQKLERGEYSHIPPSHMKGYSPVARMLNGPFRKDVERIFDNAMLFNPPNDWIHQAALVVKKAVIKKIEQVSATLNGGVGRQRKPNSMYMEYDSDVDIYVYESDPDEEYGTSRKRAKRPNANTKSPSKEDAAARGIERGIPMQKLIGESFGLRGPLVNLPIISNAADFTLPTGWKCRHKRQIDDGAISLQPSRLQQQSISELDDLMCLHRLVQERDQVGLRRSTRASDDADVDASREKSTPTNVVEYDFMWNLNVPKLPGNRVEVEMACERLHETYFAKLFQSNGNDLEAANINSNGWGRFFEGSFPPFLGRIVPMAPDLTANDDTSSWEIREHNIVPALRWILRGLLHTEHVTLLGSGLNESPSDLGVLIPSHVYYVDDAQVPFDVVDVRELTRRKRANDAPGGGQNNMSEDEVELSAYEKARAERVARNAERLQSLGLT